MTAFSRILRAMTWKHAFGEVLLIFTGITLALLANSWYENQQLRRDEMAALAQLQVALGADLERIKIRYDRIGQTNQEIVSLIEHLETGQQKQENISAGIESIDTFATLYLTYGPYETLKARGIDLISDESLRVKISSLYEDEIPGLVENSIIDRRLSRDRILTFKLELFWLDASDDWNLKESPSTNWQNDLVTLARYRSRTLVGYYLPSFERTMDLMREVLAEIDAKLDEYHAFE
jgi:hypothetical protein